MKTILMVRKFLIRRWIKLKNKVIIENFKLAQSLGLRGTPASVINDSIYPGYIKYEVLSNLVK